MPRAKRIRLYRAQKLLFCPDCGKRFANEIRVLQHLNQPSTGCGSWIDELSCHCRTPTGQNGPVVEPRYQPDQTHDRFSEDEIVGDVWSQGGFGSEEYPFEDTPFEDTSLFEDDPTPVVDDHPNVPSLYRGGTVFLDQFLSDEYVALCQENLYYPFVSGVDWELASWLLRSCLSMAAIDEFLSLQLVCPFFFLLFFFEANWYPRLSSCPSHFDRQRNFAFAQKCYHLALAGNPALSALGSLQSGKPSSTIGTRSNVSSPYSVTPSSVHTSLSSRAKYGLRLCGSFRFMRIGCWGIMPGVYRYANYFSDLDAFLTLQRIKYPMVEHFSVSCCLPTRQIFRL